jgi:hypothetical protein
MILTKKCEENGPTLVSRLNQPWLVLAFLEPAK